MYFPIHDRKDRDRQFLLQMFNLNLVMRKHPASRKINGAGSSKNIKVIKGKRKSRVKGNKGIPKQMQCVILDGILNGEKNNYKRYEDNRETLVLG